MADKRLTNLPNILMKVGHNREEEYYYMKISMRDLENHRKVVGYLQRTFKKFNQFEQRYSMCNGYEVGYFSFFLKEIFEMIFEQVSPTRI